MTKSLDGACNSYKFYENCVQNFNLKLEGKNNLGASVLGEIHQMDVKKSYNIG